MLRAAGSMVYISPSGATAEGGGTTPLGLSPGTWRGCTSLPLFGELALAGVAAFAPVVAHLHREDYGRAEAGHDVGDEQGPVAEQYALYHEKQTAETHQQECRHGNALSIVSAYRINSLRQIAKYHADTRCIPNNSSYHGHVN